MAPGDAVGAKFRRQHSVGAFVLDFYCPALRLAIEIDGPSHDLTGEADSERQNWIEGFGITFLRFSNAQVYEHLADVIETIRVAVEEKKRVLAEEREIADGSEFSEIEE